MSLFWNRGEELTRIKRHLVKGGFGYVTGRRRVGKTALLVEAVRRFGGVYHQAVEGTPQQQLLHFAEELREPLPVFRGVTPRTWSECLHLLAGTTLPRLLVVDEFPYWVQGDPTLPSLFQKWVDHELPKHRTLVLVSGSSQSMLYAQFLHHAAPLYGRAMLHLHLPPLSYRWFCRALRYAASDPSSFTRFSLVGGVPHYWRLLPRQRLTLQADALYFRPAALLAEEPIRLIRDEGIVGSLPKAIVDLVGRGVAKPSELAARLGTVHGNLSRPLAMLLELGVIHRELPFGESSRTTKRVLYTLHDPVTTFYYGSYLPFRSRWATMRDQEKAALLTQHTARCWEQYCRQVFPGSSRYWEGGEEFDLVAPDHGGRGYLVAECKWAKPTPSEEDALLQRLQERFSRTTLSRTLQPVRFRIFSHTHLSEIADRPLQAG